MNGFEPAIDQLLTPCYTHPSRRDDDRRPGRTDLEYLTRNDFQKSLSKAAATRPKAILAEQPTIILDVMLPGKDGFEVRRGVHATPTAGVIPMLTARDEDFDRILGLEMGADDYIAKPGPAARVLLARIKAPLVLPFRAPWKGRAAPRKGLRRVPDQPGPPAPPARAGRPSTRPPPNSTSSGCSPATPGSVPVPRRSPAGIARHRL